MTANPDLGIRFWTPSSVFLALPPLRQPAPLPAICGDSVAALALERTQSPMVFSTTRDGHDALGEFAPEFARLNDDVLFGEVWNRTGA